ncbi:hypothetical protein [Halopenitus sp. POP-27]|uniref:hypothetical protein n=1 Tax=Halopenitus sp. POP-27 TaxID=2994425 RepID=UPI0024698EF7|nr:hypothetical protein [Halopenitus sp. POP-27]
MSDSDGDATNDDATDDDATDDNSTDDDASHGLHVIDRFADGIGWVAYPDEPMQRASHAIAIPNEEARDDGGTGGVPDVWVIDPVDPPGEDGADRLDALLADLGDVAGVVCCLDRHKRDAAAVATRHDVAVWIPEWMTGVAAELDAPVERFGPRLADTGFEAIRVKNTSIPPWQEVALFDGSTLIVPEAVGTNGLFLAAGEGLGVHPALRPFPPRKPLRGLDPDRILVGHGEGIYEHAGDRLAGALAGARRRAPSAYLNALRAVLGS